VLESVVTPALRLGLGINSSWCPVFGTNLDSGIRRNDIGVSRWIIDQSTEIAKISKLSKILLGKLIHELFDEHIIIKFLHSMKIAESHQLNSCPPYANELQN
jgi:hypothetical protein